VATLRLGSRGLPVFALQRRLVAHGWTVALDGEYGPATAAAVERFQRAAGLVDDGIAGPLTLAALELPPAELATSTIDVHGIIVPRVRCAPLRAFRDGRQPTVTSRFKTHEPTRPDHNGVDIFYRYLPSDPSTRIGDGGREKNWWIPDDTMAIACAPGRVLLAGPSPTGYRVWVDHRGVSLGYFHLSRLACSAGDEVEPGDEIGIVGHNPRKQDAKHLHFELHVGALKGYPAGCHDPEDWIRGAAVLAAV
jgi:murein DD-endopeptidase MepM/ murein hydrolase activator NlpD